MNEKVLEDFEEFLRVNMRLMPGTVKHTLQDIRRFLDCSGWRVSYQAIAAYLRGYLGKAPKTYNGQITALRRFVRDFLRMRFMKSFKMAPVDEMKQTRVPTKAEVKQGFMAQQNMRAKAIYLFTATTGLRKGEILGLTKDKVDPKLRSVIPKHFTRKKRSGVTFYNEEAEKRLLRYHQQRDGDDEPRMFVISERQWRKIWNSAGLTSKQLRAWFSTEMGELGVPDRYVDIFQGRAPRSVLAKHYTGKGLQRLKRIYDKAGLRVLS